MDAKFEYDRFGPWILEVNEKHGMPPLFESYVNSGDPPVLCIKIPRDIERRKAHPGMHLYDYVLSMFNDRLQVLERQGDTVNAIDVRPEDIRCIEVQEDLLTGRLRLYTPGKTLSVRFNTVSTDYILKLTNLVRQNYTKPSESKALEELSYHPEETMSHTFTVLLSKEIAADSNTRVLVMQNETDAGLSDGNMLRLLKNAVTGKKLLESMILFNGKELIVFYRTPFYRYRKQAIYSINKLYIPVDKLTGIAIDKDNTSARIVRLTLTVSQHIFPLMLSQNNPSLMPFIGAITDATGLELHKGRNYLDGESD